MKMFMLAGAPVIAEIKEGHVQSNDIYEDCISLRILRRRKEKSHACRY